MEKNTIDLNLVIKIVNKAIKENYQVRSYGSNSIIVFDKCKDYNRVIRFDLFINSESIALTIESNRGYVEIKDLTEEEILRFRLLCKECEKYQRVKLIEDISNFLVEEKKEVDLDNEDEE